MLKILKGVVKIGFLGVAVVGMGFIPWKGRPLKDHALDYGYEAWEGVKDKAYQLARFEEKKRREVLKQIQKMKKEREQKKKKSSPKESITAAEEKRLEEILEKHSK